MSAAPKVRMMPGNDPAGLDRLVMAAGEGLARWGEGLAARHGIKVEIWDGPNGLGAVLGEHIERAGVPNKRLAELVTPRAIVESLAAPKKRRRAVR